MNITILKHFIAIAKSNSIKDASTQYQITQSNLSRSLNILEKHVGEQLYHRHQRKTGLTVKGRTIFQEILHLVETYEKTIRSIQSDTTKERVYIGFIHGMGNVILPPLLDAIEHDQKSIEIIPLQGTMEEVMEWLQTEKIIIAINLEESFSNELYTTHLYDDRYSLISHKNSHIPYGDTIRLTDIVHLPLIASNKNPIKNLQQLCLENNIVLNFPYTVETPSLLWDLISHNKGHALQSALFQLPDFINKNMFTIRNIAPPIIRPIAIGTNKYKSMSPNYLYIYNQIPKIIKSIIQSKGKNP